MTEDNQERLRELDEHKESIERGRRMTPEQLANRMAEHNKKKKEERERNAP